MLCAGYNMQVKIQESLFGIVLSFCGRNGDLTVDNEVM